MDRTTASFYFDHGLGDTSNLTRLVPIYNKYGIDVEVATKPDKFFPLAAVGAKLSEHINGFHGWWIPDGPMDLVPGSPSGWLGNKPGSNMRHFGLDRKASMDELWNAYKKQEVSLHGSIPEDIWIRVWDKIRSWKPPIVLWHSIGNTSQGIKSFNDDQRREFCHEFLDRFDGTLLILDWDNRTGWSPHHRLKHLQIHLGGANLQELAALMYYADLMIGIDSGPLYYASLTDIDTVGIYFPALHPSEYMVPWSRCLTLTSGDRSRSLDPSKRFEFQIIDTDGSMKESAYWCAQMLEPNRYFSERVPTAVDMQFQQLVLVKCRGAGTGVGQVWDRNQSFDRLFLEARYRFHKPNIIETGCIRSAEDWGGAGFSTALFGRYAQITGGTLTSFDINSDYITFARQWCRQFGDSVKIVQEFGNQGIETYEHMIDILYLDSQDIGTEGYQQCNLDEFKAAEPKLHEKSLVLIDDTPSYDFGKGVLTLPYALSKGWRVLYAGYQVLLCKVN